MVIGSKVSLCSVVRHAPVLLALSFKQTLSRIALAGENAFPADGLEAEPHSADPREKVYERECGRFVWRLAFGGVQLPEQA